MAGDRLTTTTRRECLRALHWSQRMLAGILGMDERTVRRTFQRDDCDLPAEVDAWLKRRADAMLADPPPRLFHVASDEAIEQLRKGDTITWLEDGKPPSKTTVVGVRRV